MTVVPARSSEAAWEWLQTQFAGRPLPGVLTLIGLGDLELLEALERYAPAAKLLVLEPDAARARYTLTNRYVDQWRRAGRLIYLAGPDYSGADQAWRVFPTRFEQPPLLVHPASANAAGLRAAVAVLAKIVFGAKQNADARRRFAPRYLLNSIRNLPGILNGGDVRALAACAQGAPAIVVGAGPSLDASLDELARLASGAVIIATDTSLRPLLGRGIAPQFVVALDPSELNGRHLLNLPACANTWLIAESALDPCAVAAFQGRTLWFRVAAHQPWPWLNTLGVDVGKLEVWGSVLTAAFQVAALAGCDPIVAVGADLSFPEGRPYVRGTTYEFDWAWAAGLGTPVEETWRAQMAARKDLRVERDVTGADTPTTGVMLEFRDWLVAQARKGGRRFVNATGRGLLLGDGVEQAPLADVIPAGREVMARFDREVRPNAPHAAAVVRGLKQPPVDDWREFSGDSFDAGKLREALASLPPDLKHEPRRETATLPNVAPLPELLTRLRAALRADAPLPTTVAAGQDEHTRTLARAFELLHTIVTAVAGGADFAGFPHPDHIDGTPAGASAMWPEDLRPAVLRFEALLGRAWAQVGPVPVRHGRLATVLPHDVWRGTSTNVDTPIHATHACLLAVIEWLRCAASNGEGLRRGLDGVIARLWTLERELRSYEESCRPRTTSELIIEAPWTCVPRVVLPIQLSIEALWGLRTGTGASLASVSEPNAVQVSVRTTLDSVVIEPEDGVVSIMPRRLDPPGWPRVKLAGHASGGALCVVPGALATVLVDAEGRISPYQTWPRPITGALSLGARGEVAWNGALGAKPGTPKPYLMYRRSPGSDVHVITLPFRPASGVWWRERLYMNGLPTASSAGGFGSWAPGERPVLRSPHLSLQGLVPGEDGLRLEPYAPVAGQGIGRWRAAGMTAWTWTPGRPATPRRLGALGAASASASHGGWTAVAYPQADRITLTGPDGHTRHMHCYFPIRLAWAGESLLVGAAARDLLIFDRLITELGAQR